MPDTPGSRSFGRHLPKVAVPRRLEGRVVLPGDARYEAARLVDNAAIDRRPAVIVLAQDLADVVATLRVADESGLPNAMRRGSPAWRTS